MAQPGETISNGEEPLSENGSPEVVVEIICTVDEDVRVDNLVLCIFVEIYDTKMKEFVSVLE
jgi:hypothetical protein